jgi:hypothetical protein
LALRLYRVARSGSCVEETHWICSYRFHSGSAGYADTRERSRLTSA